MSTVKTKKKSHGVPPILWYRAVRGSRFSDKDAEKIGPALAELVREQQATLAADDIVAAARPKDSPLHEYFTWDNATAAALRREDEARSIVRSILVCWQDNRSGEPIEESTRLLSFVVTHEEAEEEEEEAEDEIRPGRKVSKDRRSKRLITFDKAADDKRYAKQILLQAEHELRRFRARYNWYLANLPQFRRRFRRVWQAINALGR